MFCAECPVNWGVEKVFTFFGEGGAFSRVIVFADAVEGAEAAVGELEGVGAGAADFAAGLGGRRRFAFGLGIEARGRRRRRIRGSHVILRYRLVERGS